MDIDIVKRFIYGAKEAYKKVDNHSYNFPITIESAYRLATNIETLLKEQPEIVLCKDCKYRSFYIRDGISFAKCELKHNWMPQPDWYCADGERKDDDALDNSKC